MRSGPGTEHAVTRQVARDQRLVEIERQGDWVRAEIAGTGGATAGSMLRWWRRAADPRFRRPRPKLRRLPAKPSRGAARRPDRCGCGGRGRAARADTIAPGAGVDFDAVDLQRFRDSVAYLNSRSALVGGSELFTGVEPLGGGAVQVGASDAWASMPPAGQRSYASALLDRWSAATGRSDQIKVQIVDDGGRVIMEESRP